MVISEGLRGAESAALPRWCRHSQSAEGMPPSGIDETAPQSEAFNRKGREGRKETKYWCKFRTVRSQKHLIAKVAKNPRTSSWWQSQSSPQVWCIQSSKKT